MFTRAILSSVNAARRIAVPAPRYTSQRTNDPGVLEQEKQKNLLRDQHSTHTHAPGWNELPASDSESHIKSTGNSEEMAKATLKYARKLYPDEWSEAIWEHTNAPYTKDVVEGPLSALARGARKVTNAFGETAATPHEEVQDTLSDKGARASHAVIHTPREEAVSKGR
ncbi:hypothetical protein FRC11_000407 [Ceratobasidium sp. 423]|nr:hypothetical protein FRC11_000407 [Ceratobasidium sp. 423]